LISLSRYAELFRVEGLRATLIASIVGRLPIGIATLAILLFLQDRTGSFALAGATAALYVLGLATVAPFLGRLIDRFGPRPVLSAGAVLYPCMMAAMVVLALADGAQGAVAFAALVAGASFPPITACMRSLYPRLVPDPGLLRTAYSADAALVESVFILGPALVALFVAADFAYGAVLFAAVCAGAGNVVFLRSPAVRGWVIQPPAGRRSLLGPLRSPPLLAVFAANFLYAFAFGLYELAVTAFAAERGVPAAAGVILALASVGSAAGVIIYGSRDWKFSVSGQFLANLGLMAAGLLLIAPVTNLYLFGLLNVIACATMAPAIASQSLLVSRLAAREMLAETFTWSATCLLAGISGGIAAGGLLAEYVAPSWILVSAALSTLMAMAVVWAGVRDQVERRKAKDESDPAF
jgi:MFS family permease